VLWVGHLIPRKDPVLAVEGVPSLGGAHLVMLGEGELRDEVAARAAELGVEDRVHLLGNVPHPQYLRYLTEADVLLVTSRAEGLPQTIFDAMLAGTAVAAMPVSGIPEMVADGETGVLIRERTGGAVADAVARAMDDREAQEIVRRARERVTTLCAWPVVAEKYARAYGFGGNR
jgi:D-inositol-3-phosphate glycosyltransferase